MQTMNVFTRIIISSFVTAVYAAGFLHFVNLNGQNEWFFFVFIIVGILIWEVTDFMLRRSR